MVDYTHRRRLRRSYEEASFVRRALLAVLTLAGLIRTVQTAFPLYYIVYLPFSGESRIGKYIVAATKVAEEDILQQGLIPPAFPLKMLLVDDRCSGLYAMRGSLQHWYNLLQSSVLPDTSKPDFAAVAVGALCSASCRPLANYFGAFNVSFVSAGCTTSDLSNKDFEVGYPTTARVVSPWNMLVLPFMNLLRRFSFKRVGFLAIESDQDWLQFQDGLKKSSEKENVRYEVTTMKPSQMGEEITEDLILISSKALKPMIGKSMVIALLLNDREVLATLLAAKRLNMLLDYVYIAFGYSPDVEGEMWQDPDEAKYVQEGLVSINILRPEGPKWTDFERRVKAAVPAVQAAVRNSNLTSGIEIAEPVKQLSVYAGLLYDSMLLWASAVKKSNALDPPPTTSPLSDEAKANIFAEMLRSDITGMTGPIKIMPSGDRLCNLSVDIIQNGQFVPILSYTAAKELFTIFPKLWQVTWPGGRKTVPVGHPEPCGFERELCPQSITEKLHFRIGVSFGVFLVVLIIIILVWWFCFYRKAKEQAEVNAINAWIVNCDEVLTDFEGKSIAGAKRLSSAVRRVTFGSMGAKQQTFSLIGYYKGTVVSIKQVERGSVDRHDPTLFSELKEMRSIKHENVNGFVGVCISAPNVCCLTVYCKNGSLQDIIQDEAFDLGTEFKISFAMDIAHGMEHLHESVIRSHGRLHSSNCVVDNKWTCKITDYGMGKFRRREKPQEKNDKYFLNKFWTAPELLRMAEEDVPLYGTQKGDVYSYGIILQELAMRDLPYSKLLTSMTYQDVVQKVKMASDPPFRPKVPESACSAEWMRLMTQCWEEDPEQRPSFKEVMNSAQLLSGGQAINIVDNMMKRLEKHNQKLEELVAERTAELNVEKKKVESLLYNILPKSVAESLMRQGRITPEAFDSATIYFSDIVGFMKINRTSTAYQVVELLNGIYSIFDGVTDKYDVYKCETIGDVYMVASGLPIRNGDRHASEIATMALHLLSSVASFKIPHMPNKVLQLRIGIHSGPVVAGVVGQKMPHYCLFGDTVNTASRMQSGGLALRIHSSNSCAEILMSSGEFQLECRGEREVKGKGLMKTYWVLSKTGFDMPLPDLSLAAKLEEHYFK